MVLETLFASQYCQLALQLCQRARLLRVQKRMGEAAEVCSFVSTLCVENEDESCKHEAKLCAYSAKQLVDGLYSQAEKTCLEARRTCPMNYALRGS